jgi:hypothetical protein
MDLYGHLYDGHDDAIAATLDDVLRVSALSMARLLLWVSESRPRAQLLPSHPTPKLIGDSLRGAPILTV